MKLEIKKLTFDNFRGFEHKEIEFSGNTKVLGANAQGKTTLMFGWFWLMSGKSDVLATNPSITPKGMTECESRVTAEITIDDKPCTLSKSQKYKEKTDDSGKVMTTTSNSYSINGVNKSEKEFVADLKERGVDMDNFLILSHPFAFTADTSKKGREEMRKILFETVTNVNDLEMSKDINVPELSQQLEQGYKLNEVEQMAKAELKALNERVGKDNEIINSRINGMLESKSKQDIKVLEAQKAEYEAEVERIENEIDNLVLGKSDHMKKLTDLKVERDKMVYEANNKLMKQKAELESAMHEMKLEISDKKFKMAKAEDAYDNGENVLTNARHDLEKQRDLFKDAQDTVFDEGDTICPTCLRELPKDKIEHLKAEFDKKKADRIKVLKASGKALNERISALESELKSTKEEIEKFKVSVADSEHKMLEIEAEMNKIPASVDMTTNEDYAKLIAQIAKLEAEIPKNSTQIVEELKSQRNVNKAMLNQILCELGAIEHNKEIDKKVDELKKERKDSEIKRAKTEKMLHEVDVFKKHKNDKLSEEINSHFSIAKFRLFRVLKNGTMEEACDVLVDGKELNSQLNQSTQILALTDIIAGLQTFKKQFLPVFLDDHALFTAKTDKMIPLECQVIKLIAMDGVNGLEIKED